MSRATTCRSRPAGRRAALAAATGALALSTFMTAAPVLGQDRGAGDAKRGLAYAERNCIQCHDVSASSQEGKQAASFAKIANTPGMTALALKVWFQSPHPNMPNLVLQPEDQRDVIAYILTLKRP